MLRDAGSTPINLRVGTFLEEDVHIVLKILLQLLNNFQCQTLIDHTCVNIRVLIRHNAKITAFWHAVKPDYSFFDIKWTPGVPIFGIPG